jgi:hypothetical protein
MEWNGPVCRHGPAWIPVDRSAGVNRHKTVRLGIYRPAGVDRPVGVGRRRRAITGLQFWTGLERLGPACRLRPS